MKLLFDRIGALTEMFESTPLIDSFRVLHGRGQCFTDFEFSNVDFYQPVLVFVLYKAPPENWLAELVGFLQNKLSENLSCVLVQRRYLINSPSEVILGVMPEKVFARRGDLLFNLHLGAQQNAGYFLDMEAGRQWIERHANNKCILNLFAYTCAFSVVAVAAGAQKVVNVDMSSPALNLGRSNHQLNGMPKEKTEFVAENILKSWSRVKKPGPYDLVIIDPPSYQKGSFIAEKDYGKVIRRLPELMPDGGLVLACLNAPELGDDFLKKQFEQQLPQAEFIERLAAHQDFPDVNSEQQLKLLVYRIR
ncbi:MAG: methyltransferase [Gammaproteobacteria bacterium]|nr:MAG: methyltransferase [Gammaproteobacteria bacterium]